MNIFFSVKLFNIFSNKKTNDPVIEPDNKLNKIKKDQRDENIPLIIKFEKANITKLCVILPNTLTATGPNTSPLDISNITVKLITDANNDGRKIGVNKDPENRDPKKTFNNAVIKAIFIFFCRMRNNITAFPIPILKKVGLTKLSIKWKPAARVENIVISTINVNFSGKSICDCI